LVVAQAFKESLGLEEVLRAMLEGVEAAGLEARPIRGSDGGDGLLEAVAAKVARWQELDAEDPLQRLVRTRLGWLDVRTAIVESRLVCGLSLLEPQERDPLRTTTRGLGLLLDRLVAHGASRIVVGLGGSATVDGGVGMARVWGWMPLDRSGRPLDEGGGALERLVELEPGRTPSADIIALCDVQNPLLGPDGAARVFAPQKGASQADVERLARGLERLVEVTAGSGGREWAASAGAGAAGGLGFGLLAFAGAKLRRGASWVLDLAGFDQELAEASLVVVGEGAFDRTSLAGKLAGEVIRRSQRSGVPVVLLAPRAEAVPPGVEVETGGGWWNAAHLARRTEAAVSRVLRLLRS
jgi:glycerate kinase